eukprot:CAMPEP_0181214364 /NCGR_PEP_ID=MMETSP1096-20121128/25411_1 /TAXON_ID=156174 ORGANISM="Chrysochromulina ericina, Strain CCMP281" /NCGR_SAMPLE_ID=MMETSP1096 /ASSEMBLY_ACC=CAM_ASM_000453 /LENGTH=163 /DNA_ID=CAMNT_0023306089 /DNA_START=349 /DNA_END=840 /DNA_ORIENTATION=-
MTHPAVGARSSPLHQTARDVADQAPHGCHLPAMLGRPLWTTPAVTVPARLFRRIFLRIQHDNIVCLAPCAKACVRDERVVEPVPVAVLRATVEGRATAVEEDMQPTRLGSVPGATAPLLAAPGDVHVPSAGEGHVPAGSTRHAKWGLIEGDHSLRIDGARVGG